MGYWGQVKNGVVVIEGGVKLPEGMRVRVEVVTEEGSQFKTLSEGLLKLAGTVEGLPADAARNHDRYLYGTPKYEA